MKIHVVMGTTGEYSDRIEWPVAAYADEAMARAHVVVASAEARKLYKASQGEGVELGTAADPNRVIDYTGASYDIIEVDLRDEVPEPFAPAPEKAS